MKIGTIKIMERKNLGDYQHRECELTATIDEGENESEAIKRTAALVSWHLNLPERQREYQTQKALLTSEDATVKAKAEKYVAHFDKAKAEVEG